MHRKDEIMGNKSVKEYRSKNIYDIDFEQIMTATISASADKTDVAKFRISHCKRVADLAVKLAKKCGNGIDLRKVYIMGIIHDMFKYVDTGRHGKLAADYLEKFYLEPFLGFNRYKKLSKEKNDHKSWYQVLGALTVHSEKETMNLRTAKGETTSNIYMRILMDADVLDKLTEDYIRSYQDTFEPERSITDIINHHLNKVNKYSGVSNGFLIIKCDLINKLEAIKFAEAQKGGNANELPKPVQN